MRFTVIDGHRKELEKVVKDNNEYYLMTGKAENADEACQISLDFVKANIFSVVNPPSPVSYGWNSDYFLWTVDVYFKGKEFGEALKDRLMTQQEFSKDILQETMRDVIK